MLMKDTILFDRATDPFKNKLNKTTDSLKTCLAHMLHCGVRGGVHISHTQGKGGLKWFHITPCFNPKCGAPDVTSLSRMDLPS